jgi:hypothetical protein
MIRFGLAAFLAGVARTAPSPEAAVAARLAAQYFFIR